MIGKNEKEINNFIETLSIFIEPKERSRCSFVVEGRGYVPDLLIQGINETNNNSYFNRKDFKINRNSESSESSENLGKKNSEKNFSEKKNSEKNFSEKKKSYSFSSDISHSAPNYPPPSHLFKSDQLIHSLLPSTIVIIHRRKVIKVDSFPHFIENRKHFLFLESENASLSLSHPNSAPKKWTPSYFFFFYLFTFFFYFFLKYFFFSILFLFLFYFYFIFILYFYFTFFLFFHFYFFYFYFFLF